MGPVHAVDRTAEGDAPAAGQCHLERRESRVDPSGIPSFDLAPVLSDVVPGRCTAETKLDGDRLQDVLLEEPAELAGEGEPFDVRHERCAAAPLRLSRIELLGPDLEQPLERRAGTTFDPLPHVGLEDGVDEGPPVAGLHLLGRLRPERGEDVQLPVEQELAGAVRVLLEAGGRELAVDAGPLDPDRAHVAVEAAERGFLAGDGGLVGGQELDPVRALESLGRRHQRMGAQVGRAAGRVGQQGQPAVSRRGGRPASDDAQSGHEGRHLLGGLAALEPARPR